jgi:DNA-binding winged helix-turn-helix (wHTH) protein
MTVQREYHEDLWEDRDALAANLRAQVRALRDALLEQIAELERRIANLERERQHA